MPKVTDELTSHPYRDANRKMSPLYFDTGHDRRVFDLREIKSMRMDTKFGHWTVYMNGSTENLGAETGARVYNALRAYAESHYE